MNYPEFVKVEHAGHNLRELKVTCELENKEIADRASGFTDCKRFASGLDRAYCITVPLVIHSVIMWKRRGSKDTETPNKGRTFGWDKCFQPMIS